LPESQSLVQAAAKPAPIGTAARLELVSSPLEAEIRASLLRTAAEQVRIGGGTSTLNPDCHRNPKPNADPDPDPYPERHLLRTAAEQVRVSVVRAAVWS